VTEKVKCALEGQPQQFEFWGRRRDGEIFPKNVRLARGTYFGRVVVIAFAEDITERKRAEEATRESKENLRRREAILNSIAFAADQFLKSPAWTTSIQAILEKFGETAEASRVYIFKILSNQGSTTIVSQLFEWCSPDARPMITDPLLQRLDMTAAGLERWVHLLASGQPVFGKTRELPEDERAEFIREDILSIACVPIMIENEWWGFIGLDDCARERTWSESEMEALQIAANILSAAIQREVTGDAVQKQLKELVMLHGVALAGSAATDADALIEDITQIIEATLRPDNCGILVVDASRKFLLPHASYRGNVLNELHKQSAIDIGVAGKVASTGRALRIPDVRAVPEFVEVSPGIRSELCVPIISNDQVAGVINLESRRVNAFDEADERLIQTIAGSLATTIVKIKLFEAEGRRAREAEDLRKATTALTSSLDLNTLLETTLDLVANFAPYDSASIEFIEGDTVKVVAGRRVAPTCLGRTYQVDLNRWDLQNLRQPIIIPDVRNDERFTHFEGTGYIRSWMGVPLYAQDKLIGFINLDNKLEDFYTEAQASVVQTFANQAAIAIQNAHLFDAEQQRRREAETLREAVAALASELEQEQAVQRILEQLAKVVPYRSASVQILGDGYLEIVGGTGWEDASQILGVRFPVPGDNPNTVVIQERRSHILKNAPSEFEPFRRDPHDHIRSWLGVPLIVRDSVIGMLAIDHSEPDFYSSEHARLAETFANQAAIAIANARVFEEEKRRSQIIEALADIANELATTQEMGHLLDNVAQRALTLLKASHVAIYLVQPDNETVKVVSAQGSYSRELISHSIRIGEGITGNIIAGGKSEIINDTRTDPRTITVPGTPKGDGALETMMSSALILRGKAIGAINAWRLRSDGLFNESELNFLISIAHQTSISIELSRLFEQTMRRAQEAAAIAEVGRDVSATLELDVVLERIARYAKDLLNAETSAVYMYEENDRKLHGIAVIGLDAEELKNDPLNLGTGIAGNIALRKSGEIVNYVASDPRAITVKGTESNPAEHIMGVPVLTKDQLMGLLVVWRTGAEQEFQPSELDFLSSLAQQAAVAIQNARSFASEQNQRLREASMLDLMRLAASSLDLDEVNLTILGHLIKLIPCDSGTIQLLRGERLLVSAAIGFPPESIKQGSTLLIEDFPLNQEVISQKKPVRIADNREDERYRLIAGVENLRATLAIPIIFRENVIGMATLDSAKVGRFTQEDEDLAMGVANNAANAIGNARLFELEQQGRQEAENLRLAAAAVTSSLDPQQVLETILIALKQVVRYDSASVLLLEGDQVRITAAQGLPNMEAAINRTFPASNRLLAAIDEGNDQPVILYDAQMDPRFERWAAADSVRGWMGVRLATRGQTMGYITLDSYRVDAFDKNSASLAQTFAYQAAAAIDNARLYQETRRRLEELEMVSRVSFALRATRNPYEMLPVLLKEVLKIMDTDSASIWLYDSATNHLDQKIASGWQDHRIRAKHLPPNDSIVGHVFMNNQVYIVEDFPSDPHAQTTFAGEIGAGWSGIGVPIRTSAQTIGVMLVAVPLPRKVEPPQVQLITTLAEIAGNAIHRAQLFDQSEGQVRRLTALRDVDTAIASSFDLRVTLNILLDHTLSQLRADAAAILSYNPEMRTLSHISSLGFHQPGNIQTSLRISGPLLNEALLERADIRVENIAEEPLFHRKELAGQEKFISYYATPLVSKGQVKGILEVYYRQPPPPETEWLDFFQAMAGQAAIAIDNSQLFDNLQRSNQELSLAYDTTLEGWGKALELRDKETQGHTLRVTELTLRLARRLRVPEADLIHIRRGVLLHDIGKMAVPDHILKKSGPLDEHEWVEMRLHPQYAYDLLLPISYLRPALDIPYCHHERWDGQGYPRRIRGEEIPIAARIFAVVDVWDALLFDRPYRRAWPRQEVVEYISAESGTRFDPRIASEFLRMVEEQDQEAE
jgi:GAF domain-containing protein